jgi:hypothetical protein
MGDDISRSYKVICISLYHEDLARLDALVSSMHSSGWTNMSRSRLIREALLKVKTEEIPKPR